MYRYTELAVRKLRADAAEFCRPSSTGHIAFVLDETTVTDELISEIAAALIGSGKRFMRAAFVGGTAAVPKLFKYLLDFAALTLLYILWLCPRWKRRGRHVPAVTEKECYIVSGNLGHHFGGAPFLMKKLEVQNKHTKYGYIEFQKQEFTFVL